MRRYLPVLTLVLAWTSLASAKGLLIPADKNLPPLAMVNYKVTIAIDDQVATTKVEQTFRNHTERQLEATYIFPVPKGASVNKFVMWVDGKEVAGELLEGGEARQGYTDIVFRTPDPRPLGKNGNNPFPPRGFPIPPQGAQQGNRTYNSLAPS